MKSFSPIVFAAVVLFMIFPSNTSTVSKYVVITPSDHNTNGVQINTNTLDVITTPNQWNIMPSSNNGWHMHISMDSSWNFLSERESTITLKTYTDSTTNSSSNQNIIFAFSQSTDKYISSTVSMNGNTSHNGIYPQCTPTHNDESVFMAVGNIDLLLNDNNETINRAHKLTKGSEYKSIPSATTSLPSLHPSPVIIQLINNPISAWTKYKYLNTECKFEAFSTQYPIDIYISAADIGQTLNINKLEIELTYNQTEMLNELEVNSDSQTDTTSFTQNDNNSLNEMMESNTKTIVYILIGITICLFMVCVALIVIVRKQSVSYKKDEIKSAVDETKSQNIQMQKIIAMEGQNNIPAMDINVHDLVLHKTTFKNSGYDNSKTKSIRTAESNVMNINDDEYSDDDDVILDIMWTAGQ